MFSPPITPNLFAYLALFSWPVVATFLYASMRVVPATIWTILAAQLLLPFGTSFKFEMIPVLDKTTIPNFCALVGCMIVTRRTLWFGSKVGIAEVLQVTFLVSPVVTSLLNGDPVQVGGTLLPGVGIYDGFSALLSQFIILIPFLLGRQFLREPPNLQQCLEIFAVAGLLYSFPLLFEIRFSPQLHYWVYGYAPSDFIQEMREGGGFRPMVFMGHGLTACFFFMTTVVAAAALWRIQIRLFRLPPPVVTIYLGAVLVFCKSSAALVYALAAVPLVRWTKPRFQLVIAAFLAMAVLLYPAMRMADVLPTNLVLQIAGTFDEARAHSLEFRFNQEEELIQRAAERPWFGWGRFGRNRVLKEDWQGIGVDTSVTDGEWIVTFGQFGLLGFFAEFGLLAFPIFRAAKVFARLPFREAVPFAAVALILALNMVDLLPNSALNTWTWLLAGALLGCSETVVARKRMRATQTRLLSTSMFPSPARAIDSRS